MNTIPMLKCYLTLMSQVRVLIEQPTYAKMLPHVDVTRCLVASGIEPRPSGLESDALTTSLPRNLYDRAETQIRSLEGLGVKGESYSNLLTPILLKQIPSELVLEFSRSQKDEGFDLSALLQFLHLEIRSRERTSQINNHKPCHYSPPTQDRTKNKGSYFPGQRMKPPPNGVHFRPHSFPTLLEKVELRC
ncbi:uncharacterized protein TNCV_3590181 [Trichonephila clavipes]|nr:uncharacterized protein TNCV_3590181 [Trichonephila clavipes]